MAALSRVATAETHLFDSQSGASRGNHETQETCDMDSRLVYKNTSKYYWLKTEPFHWCWRDLSRCQIPRTFLLIGRHK